MLVTVVFTGCFTLETLDFKPFDITEPGPILLLVALLQIWSYPMHDPVMMDRGFLADRSTTRRSFIHAGWLSALCILAFGSLGVIAGSNAISGEDMNTALSCLPGEWPTMLFSASVVISAMSTLDSTLSSSSKLIAVDIGAIGPSTDIRRALQQFGCDRSDEATNRITKYPS